MTNPYTEIFRQNFSANEEVIDIRYNTNSSRVFVRAFSSSGASRLEWVSRVIPDEQDPNNRVYVYLHEDAGDGYVQLVTSDVWPVGALDNNAALEAEKITASGIFSVTPNLGGENFLTQEDIVFGSHFQHLENEGVFSTGSRRYVRSDRLMTSSLVAGQYRIEWSYEAAVEENEDYRDTHQVILDGDEDSPLASHTVFSPYTPVAGWAVRDLSAGIHTIDIQLREGDEDQSKVRRRRIAIWRVA
jgi:hypothetical protein